VSEKDKSYNSNPSDRNNNKSGTKNSSPEYSTDVNVDKDKKNDRK
jgi:hypothetical protein